MPPTRGGQARRDEMAVAEYVTKEDLEEALKPIRWKIGMIQADLAEMREEMAIKADLAVLEAELKAEMATKADLAVLKADIIDAIQRGSSANY